MRKSVLMYLLGSVKVQICTAGYKPIEGFTYDECSEIKGDYLNVKPVWKKHADLADIISRPGKVRLQIKMEQAELFAINGDFGFNINPEAQVYEDLI